MNRFTDEQVAKLPKWAQSMVNGLTQELERTTKDRDRALNADAVKESPITMQVYDGGHSSNFRDVPLPQHAKVAFRLPDGLKVEVSLRKSGNRTVVEVMETASRRQLLIEPQVGNVIYLVGGAR